MSLRYEVHADVGGPVRHPRCHATFGDAMEDFARMLEIDPDVQVFSVSDDEGIHMRVDVTNAVRPLAALSTFATQRAVTG